MQNEAKINNGSSNRRWWGLLFICVSLLIIALDNTVLNVALPSISRDLKAANNELQWIVDAYILVFASLLLTMGAVGDRIGRKRILQFGIVWFAGFSFLAALSNSSEMLIGARALLGIGGSVIMPATLSIVTASFRDPKERAQAIGIWAAVFGLGVGLGPLVGGALLERFEWGAVFLINIPVCAIALIGGYVFLDESKDENAPSPDFPGVVLSITGLFALVYAIIEAGVKGWGASNVLISFAAAAVLLGAFFTWESRAKNAMLPMYLFRNPSFTGANVAITLMMFGMLGVFFAMSQLFQSVFGYSALESGVRLLPISLTIMVAAGMSAQLAQRIGTKRAVGFGFLVAAIGMFILSQVTAADASYTALLVGMVIMAAGMGSAMAPATNSIMGSVPLHKAGVGSAMNDTTREIGGAMGVAILGTVINHTYLNNVEVLKGQLDPGTYDFASSSIQGAHIVAQQMGGSPVAQTILQAADKAFASGMADAMFISVIVMLAASVFTFLVLPDEIRCIEPECEEEARELGVGEMVPAAGD